MPDTVIALTAEELAAELAKSRMRRAAQDERARREVQATGRRYCGEEAHSLGIRPPLLADGTPIVLSRLSSPPSKRKKKK